MTRHPTSPKTELAEGIRREELLEARPIEEAIASEAKPREAMNVTTPPVNRRTIAKEEAKSKTAPNESR
jgi:hypothetical protein